MKQGRKLPAGRVNNIDRKAVEAWTMRVAGFTWEEISQRVGYANRHNTIRAVRDYFGELPQIDREELRGIARARGEWLWRHAAEDVEKRRPGAVRAAVAALQRQAALDGLDVPQAHVLVTPTEAEYQMLVARILGASGIEAPTEPDVLELPGLESTLDQRGSANPSS
ncbi:hypothetical protein [Microbacterium sp. NPDC058389]|uniref:hypothetical protein n=1 Tax=Microbacterium sp. NPDC058389 TaxID=3346475 RepID=UPI0036599243